MMTSRAHLEEQFEELVEENERLTAEVKKYRMALWEEYRDGFNDLGKTRQARWESAEAYADALMVDFDSASGRQE